jgi:hypothetical protein
MGAVIDHLRANHEIVVLREFKELNGTVHRAGERAVLRAMRLDWVKEQVLFEWEQDGAKRTLTFALHAKDGPRNGRMRDYFELGEYVPIPEHTLAGQAAAKRKRLRAAIPEVRERPVTAVAEFTEGVGRVWALASRRRFDEAKSQLRLLLQLPDEYGVQLQRLAEDLAEMAIAHNEPGETEIYDWLRTEALNLAYSYGSGASAGGEGAVRGEWIRGIEARVPARE